MRLLVVATLSLALAAPSASGQPPARRTPAPAATERELTRLENEWTAALVRRDTAAFRRILAPRFVYTEDAQVMTGDEVIRGVVGPDRVEWAGNEEMKVHDYGNTAVVTGILAMRGQGKNGPFSRRYRYTDTWLRTNGRWRIIAAQDYLIR